MTKVIPSSTHLTMNFCRKKKKWRQTDSVVTSRCTRHDTVLDYWQYLATWQAYGQQAKKTSTEMDIGENGEPMITSRV